MAWAISNNAMRLENDEIRVMLWGSPVSSRPLQSISGFSYRYTSTLYIEFDDQDKIRLADVSNEKELENLKSFIMLALSMKNEVGGNPNA